MSKKVIQATNITNTDYLSGFQYKNNVLQFFPHAEGYVNATQNELIGGGTSYTFNYVYNYTDHLGNIRLSYSQDPSTNVLKVIEENHYYPFGLKHTGYNSDQMMYIKEENFIKIKSKPALFKTSYNYKYNGKELEDELGKNTYAYGWRDYDPAIGRFNKMDRFAEKYYNLTPYQYGANNPIVFNDIRGDSILIHSEQDKDRILYENGNLFSKDRKTNKWVAYNGKNVKVDKNGNKTIGGFLGKTLAALDRIRTGGSDGNQLIGDLQNNSKYIGIKEGSNGSSGEVGGVTWNPSDTSGGPNQLGSTNRESFIGLAHELGHAHDGLDGPLNLTSIGRIGDNNIPIAEMYAMEWENKVRKENNIPLRTHYGNDANENVVGPTSLRYSMPSSIQLQVNYSNTGDMQIVPIVKNSTVVIPINKL